MRIVYIFYAFICYSLGTRAQTMTPALKAPDTSLLKLAVDPATPVSRYHFYSVEVMDCRDDTASVGYHKPHRNQYKFFILRPSASAEIASWYASALRTGEDKPGIGHLLVCLRKLRVSDESTPIVYLKETKNKPMDGADKGTVLKVEFYLQQDDHYYPLYRFDSIVPGIGKLSAKAGEFISLALAASLKPLFAKDLTAITAKSKKLSLQDILTYNQKNKNALILEATGYRKGVYASFEEFRSNKPGITDYDLVEDKLSDALFVKKGGAEYAFRDAWGYSDGKDIFVNSSNKFSQLVRIGNTFYFKGLKKISGVSIDPTTGIPTLIFTGGPKVGKTVYTADYKYYQVDMETGDVY